MSTIRVAVHRPTLGALSGENSPAKILNVCGDSSAGYAGGRGQAAAAEQEYDVGCNRGAFPDRQPIGIDRTGRAVFLYLVRPSTRDDFRGFLDRHREVLVCLPAWTLRLIFLRQFPHAYGAYQAVVREEWESPLHPRTVEELRWYFEQRRASPSERVRLGLDERLDRAAQAFERPRFYRLYRCGNSPHTRPAHLVDKRPSCRKARRSSTKKHRSDSVVGARR